MFKFVKVPSLFGNKFIRQVHLLGELSKFIRSLFANDLQLLVLKFQLNGRLSLTVGRNPRTAYPI